MKKLLLTSCLIAGVAIISVGAVEAFELNTSSLKNLTGTSTSSSDKSTAK